MRSFEVIDAEQRSPEWFRARAGRVTASRAADMLAKTKSGYSTSRKNLLVQLVAERLTGLPQEDNYQSPAMLRGIELEPKAFAAYEATTGQMATKVGFLAHLDQPIGASPDGVIGDFDGILELKVPNPATHLTYLKARTLPSDYLPQVSHHLLVSGAAYCDFMSYGPNFPEALQVFLVRVYRADVDLDAYARELATFLAEVDNELTAVLTMVNPIAQLRAVVA
jgi:putative phage-type endonuclease